MLAQARCADLEGEVERLAAERDKLMDIGNSLRAELNRALSNSFQVCLLFDSSFGNAKKYKNKLSAF